jgi:hypothetical protein
LCEISKAGGCCEVVLELSRALYGMRRIWWLRIRKYCEVRCAGQERPLRGTGRADGEVRKEIDQKVENSKLKTLLESKVVASRNRLGTTARSD